MTSPGRWKRIEPIFDSALDLPPDRRSEFLDQACAGDATLRAELDTLLRFCNAPSSFFELDLTAFAAPLFQQMDGSRDDEPATGSFVGPYRILRRLGGGGMGEVYLAFDPRLGREVALKLISPRLALDADWRRRFREEARTASTLDHPHIATIYEIGESDSGRMYMAMAYRDGESLRERIARGPLPVCEAVDIARQIAVGLAAAHAAGIVHRDVKPGNVVVTAEGEVKIVDFGLATAGLRGATTTGTLRGTVAYMSPEQTRGDPVDARSDLWSLGVVLYEMLTGVSPFQAESGQAAIFRIRHDDPVPLESLLPGIPAAVSQIVRRCLQKSPAARYPNASSLRGELEGALDSGTLHPMEPSAPLALSGSFAGFGWGSGRRWSLLFGTVCAAAVATGFFVLRPSTQPFSIPPAPSGHGNPSASWIAVLPLAVLDGSPDDAYLADGLTEELITRLSGLRDLRVIAWSSVSSYRQTRRSVGVIGNELDVGYIVTGSIRRTGNRLRVSARLVDVRTRGTIWTEEYEAALSDVIDLQDEIASRVAASLPLKPEPEERSWLSFRGTDDPEAHLLYLRGRYVLAKDDPPAFARAREYFDQALERDPTYARAWSGLSDAFDRLAWSHALHPSEAYPRARAAAERALELDPNLAEAHASLARALTSYYWDSHAAERHFRRAIELDPSNARAHRGYAAYLSNQGRLAESRKEAEAALDLDPVDFSSHLQMVLVSFFERRYDETIERSERLAGMGPGYRSVRFMLAKARLGKGEYDAALDELDRIDPEREFPPALAIRGYIHGIAGRPDEARRTLTELTARSREIQVPFDQAIIHYGLGETERALDLFEEAIELRDWRVRLLKAEPIFDALRAESRYAGLLERAGFAKKNDLFRRPTRVAPAERASSLTPGGSPPR